MKAKALLFLIAGLSMTTISNAQPNYRVRVRNGVEYILPPASNLLFRKDSVPKDRFTYFYIVIQNLGGDYSAAVNSIRQAQSWHGSIDYFTTTSARIGERLHDAISGKGCQCNTCDGQTFKIGPLDPIGQSIFIQLNYRQLTLPGPAPRFDKLARDLLLALYSFETKAGNVCPGSITWPPGISQEIIEKIFELVPVPQASSLSRFAFTANNVESFVLLNPKIILKVDRQSLYTPKNPPEKWNYNLESQVLITFYKNDQGQIRQIPFLQLNTGMNDDPFPSNSLIKDDNYSALLTSSGDLQLSENTRWSHYIALYQNYMKRNSHASSRGVDDNARSEDKDAFIGNTMLLLNNNLAVLLTTPGDPSHVKATFASGAILNAGFSRTLMQPMIHITLNGTPTTVQLGSSLSMLSQHIPIGDSFTLYRLHQGKFKKIKYANPATLLLPGDKISF